MTQQLIQNTPEWMKWRHSGIGASEANIIMGVSKHKTPKELWQEKINPTPPKENGSKNFICDKGHELEAIARRNYELETFENWQPKLIEHSDEPRFRASLDGWNDARQAVWECKYMGADKYASLQNEELTIRERVPIEYWPQLMHQAMVTGANSIHLTGIIDNKVNKELEKNETDQYTLVFQVNDEHRNYILNELLPKLTEFLEAIDNKKEPSVSKDDVVSTKDSELGKLLTKYKGVKTKLDKLSKEEKELKKQIFGITLKIHNRVECKGYKITETISDDKIVPDYQLYLSNIEMSDEKLIEKGYIKTTKGRKTQKITLKK